MVNFLRKLISCIHQGDISKNVKPVIYCESKQFFKLSRFELMTDEILLEIFEYIPLIDLYNGFVNLNFRLNILLRDVHLGISLDQNEYPNKSLLNSISYFSKQIHYIHIDHYPLLNLRKFSNLRSLIIYLPTKNQLLSINSELMPNLRRLSIGIINNRMEKIIVTIPMIITVKRAR